MDKQVKQNNEKDGLAKTVSLMRRMIREIEAGFKPPFLVIGYPAANGKIESILSFTEDDIGMAKTFSEVLEGLKDEFEKNFALNLLGLDADMLDAAHERFKQDIKIAKERVIDTLTPDKPIKSTKEAKAMLDKLLGKP